MDTTTIAILVIAFLAVLIVGGLLGFLFAGRQRTKNLRARFGPEYERAVESLGSRGDAESELQTRMKHVDSLDLKPVPAEQKARFLKEWQQAQATFVDHPEQAVIEADHLLKEVMIAKGYPAEDFDHRLADLSVNYPDTTPSYREVREIKRNGGQNGRTTEEMRQVMVLCKGLFEDLLDARVKEAAHR